MARNVFLAVPAVVALVFPQPGIVVALSPAMSSTASDTFAVPAPLVTQVEDIPMSQLIGSALASYEASSSSSLGQVARLEKLPSRNPLFISAGKPQILFIGAEYCPFCASERWSLVMALAKFGTFSDLKGTTSSGADAYPSSPSFSFYKSSFSSSLIGFVGDEVLSNHQDPATGTYAVLQPLTAQEQDLFSKWDTPPYTSAQDAGGVPFVYAGGRFVLTSTQWMPGALSGLPWPKAAAMVTSGETAASREAEAAAGFLIGDICALTHGRPASICAQVPPALLGIATYSPRS